MATLKCACGHGSGLHTNGKYRCTATPCECRKYSRNEASSNQYCARCWDRISDEDFGSEGVHNARPPYSYGECDDCGANSKLRHIHSLQQALEPVVVQAAKNDLIRNLREISEL